jgi:hypothetical protein
MDNENGITPYNSNIADLLNQLIGALRNGTETTMINNQLLHHMFMNRDSQNQVPSQSWIGWGVGLVGSTISFGLQSLVMIGQIFMMISIIGNAIGRGNNTKNKNPSNLTQEQTEFLRCLARDPNRLNQLIESTRNNNVTRQDQDQNHTNEPVSSNTLSHQNNQKINQEPSTSLDADSREHHQSKSKTKSRNNK